MVARNLPQVAVALVQTEARLLLCFEEHRSQSSFCGHSGVLVFSLLFEGICSQSIKDAITQLQKIFILWFYGDTRRHANAGSELHCWYTSVF